MKQLLPILFISLWSSYSGFSQVQTNSAGYEYAELYQSILDEYGFDQSLVNGVIYKDEYWNRIGHQFLLEDQIYSGNLVFRGVEYKNLNLKYDIYSQQIVVNISHNNSTIGFIPPNDFISFFSINEIPFLKSDFQGKPKFYQVLFNSAKLSCFYYWYKVLDETGRIGDRISYKFSESRRKNFLKFDDSFERYTNNKSFIKLFPSKIKPDIKQYIKTNHIKVNKSNIDEVKELLEYCNSLL